MNYKNKGFIAMLFSIIILILTGAIYWKIATDEIFYLCGNFSSGVSKSNVIRQLKTANLSSFKVTPMENGEVIVFRSELNFVNSQCVIELDKNEKVTLANYK